MVSPPNASFNRRSKETTPGFMDLFNSYKSRYNFFCHVNYPLLSKLVRSRCLILAFLSFLFLLFLFNVPQFHLSSSKRKSRTWPISNHPIQNLNKSTSNIAFIHNFQLTRLKLQASQFLEFSWSVYGCKILRKHRLYITLSRSRVIQSYSVRSMVFASVIQCTIYFSYFTFALTSRFLQFVCDK